MHYHIVHRCYSSLCVICGAVCCTVLRRFCIPSTSEPDLIVLTEIFLDPKTKRVTMHTDNHNLRWPNQTSLTTIKSGYIMNEWKNC